MKNALVIALLASSIYACASTRSVCPPCPPAQVVSVPVNACPEPDVPQMPELATDKVDPDKASVQDLLKALAIDRQRLLQWGKELYTILMAYKSALPYNT